VARPCPSRPSTSCSRAVSLPLPRGLGLLEGSSRHGYDLKRSYDRRFGEVKPIRFGQVYRTLSQLERDGLVEVVGVEAGSGPDRKRYAITPEGVTDLAEEVRDVPDPRRR
jgi:DNA-binding PadR family transcriptional regulator